MSKNYPSLKSDFAELLQALKQQPHQGTLLGNNCYKIRLAITSKGKGKSGGARVITYLQTYEESVYLLSIYDKGEQENISDKELQMLLNQIP